MEKKNPYKFTLGFDKTKLTHVRAAEILNSVRDKADLIASAVVAHIDGGSTEKGAVLNQEALQIMMLELVKQEVEKAMQNYFSKQENVQVEEETEEEQKADKTGELTPGVKRSLTMILISIFLWFTAYNAVTTAFSRYARTVWGMEDGGFANCLMVATVAAIISYIPIGMISAKMGRKKTIMGGLVLMLISFFAAIFFTEYHAVINLGFALIGMGWAAVSVNSLPMVVEMCSSEDVGKYTGLYYTFSMSAQIVTPILSGAFLQYVSYRTLFPYACVFTVAAMITMSMVHHGDNKPERKKNLLENFDVED